MKKNNFNTKVCGLSVSIFVFDKANVRTAQTFRPLFFYGGPTSLTSGLTFINPRDKVIMG